VNALQSKPDQGDTSGVSTSGDATNQNHAVCRHFETVSREWGLRYRRAPRRMSDLDLQLRRESAMSLICDALPRASERLHVLDIGCGAGNVLHGLPRPLAKVISIDIVPHMVKAAAVENPGDWFCVGDVLNLPIKMGTLHAAACLGVFEYLTDPQRALEGIRGALRPRGFLAISFPNKRSVFRTLSRMESWLERTALATWDRLRRRPVRSMERPQYAHTQWTVPSARKLLEDGGYIVEEVRLHTYGLWGRLGRTRASLWLSRHLSRRLGRDTPLAGRLACTAVFLARKMDSQGDLPRRYR